MASATVIDGVGVVVEVNAETDFVGKNEKFQNFVKGVAAVVAKEDPKDLEALMAAPYGNGRTVEQERQEMVLVIGENIQVRRFARFAANTSTPYIHAGGKIGVLVNFKVDGGIDATEIAKDVAMQIAALNPRFWDKSQVSQDVLDEEKKIMMAQMANDPKMASKPEQVREKIVMGKLNKFYSENCLLQQEFVRGRVHRHGRAVYRRRRQEARRQDRLRGRRSFREGRGHREEAGELRRRDRFHDQGLRLPRANNTEAGHGSVRPLFLCRTTKKRRFIFAGAMQQKLQKSL